MPRPTLIYDDALLNPETSILIQKRHPYTRNVNSETLRDSKNAFLHWGDVFRSSAQICLALIGSSPQLAQRHPY